jgi:hypothetical protein
VSIFYCLRFETSDFVAFYDSQGHDGGIRPRLHTHILLRESFADCIENIFWNPSISYTTAASIFVTAETAVTVFIPVVTVYYLRVAA